MLVGNNLTKAREQAQANADTFDIPYYIIWTMAGLAIEREAPSRLAHIEEIVYPQKKQ
jgi:hypothetical protein